MVQEEDHGFSFGHIKFEMNFRHTGRDIEWGF